MSSGLGWASDGASVEEILRGFEVDGYEGQFAVREAGQVLCFSCHEESDACDVGLEGMRRTEGASDPDDMLMIAAITCPRCTTKGTLIVNYGPEASGDDSEVLRRLHDLRPDGDHDPATERRAH